MSLKGDSPTVVDSGGDIPIIERVFNGWKGLSDMLTRKKLNTEFITKDDLRTYKKILTMTNDHLTKYQLDSKINITRGKNFVISMQLFLRNRRDVVSNLRYGVSVQCINGYH